MKGASAGNGNAACGAKAYGGKQSLKITPRNLFGPCTRWGRP